MNTTNNLHDKEAIEKLKTLIDDIKICLFCTNLKSDDMATNTTPMSAIRVCDQGNIWFFSDKNSDRNQKISKDKNVKLFFSQPSQNNYLVVNGEAQILFDKVEIEALWTPIAKIWFTEGKDDPNISIIKVKPITAHYWDVDGNKMINFLKMIASLATGTNLVSGEDGTLKV